MSLSVREYISGATGAIFTKFFVRVADGHGSVLLWQGDKVPRGSGSFGGFFPICVRCKRNHSISAWKGVIGVHTVGEV